MTVEELKASLEEFFRKGLANLEESIGGRFIGLEESLKNAELERQKKMSVMRVQLASLSQISARLDDLEQTNRTIRQAPYRRKAIMHSQRAIRAHSASGPIYR